MALQGTLDTFELPDVLRLLASTRKTGRLDLHTDRGEGQVWLADGQVVAIGTAAGPVDIGEGMFELLRARDGGFAFQPGESPASPAEPSEVEPLLAAAEDQLAEWRAIEAVVPSLHAWVALAPALAVPSVTVDADTWQIVAMIGGGMTVAELGDALGLGELAVCRVVRDVVELGLGVVTDAPAAVYQPPAVAVAFEPEPEPLAYEPDPEPVAYEPEPVAFEPEYEPATAGPLFGTPAPAPMPASPAPSDQELAGPAAAPEDLEPVSPLAADEAEEIARHLALLSPRAAQAVAAVAGEETAGDLPAAHDDGDEPVNRGLLLKFLSSVKT